MLKGERVILRAIEREDLKRCKHIYVDGQYVDAVLMGLLREEREARHGR